MRVFAGPNGSGKSTIIDAIRNHKEKGVPVDFGLYINADEIASQLRSGGFLFSPFEIEVLKNEFSSIVIESGLIQGELNENVFNQSFEITENRLLIKNKKFIEEMAQIIADFLRKKLLKERKKFSFETVFSHPGKIEIMKQATQSGYKVYFYFVATESPEINVFRVKKVRVPQQGHDVPEEKIRSRYKRSLDLMFEASQYAYQAFFFDNSGEDFRLFAHFKVSATGKKEWDDISNNEVPGWFRKYYSEKVAKT